jgi:pimeloyl-ACP methyl ester carboxylesterase
VPYGLYSRTSSSLPAVFSRLCTVQGPAAYVPYIIERAHSGDYGPLGHLIEVVTQGVASAVGLVLNLSVTCAKIFRLSQRTRCAVPVRVRSRAMIAFVLSSAPRLMISGADDPATPPSFATSELRYLPNAKQILVHSASHSDETDCTDRSKVAFVLAGSVLRLNAASCTASFHRPTFATSMTSFSKAFD